MQLLSNFEAIFKRLLNSFDHFGSFFIVKLGVRTAEEVLERANSSLFLESGVRTVVPTPFREWCYGFS